MDGGVLQEEMAKQLKRAVKESNRTYSRRTERIRKRDDGDIGGLSKTEDSAQPHSLRDHMSDVGVSLKPRELSHSIQGLLSSGQSPISNGKHQTIGDVTRCTLAPESRSLSRSENVLLMFYLEHLFPFLFPFFRPSLLEGG